MSAWRKSFSLLNWGRVILISCVGLVNGMGVQCCYVDMKEPQMAVALKHLVYQINWIFAIGGWVNIEQIYAASLYASIDFSNSSRK